MKKPGQPIQVNVMDFLQPDNAETRPPEDILKWYSPCLSFVIVTGSLFETTMRRLPAVGLPGAAIARKKSWVGRRECLRGSEEGRCYEMVVVRGEEGI